MNVVRQLVQQTARQGKLSRAVPPARLCSTGVVGIQRLTHDNLKPSLLRSSTLRDAAQTRHLSSTESYKFEVINVQDEDDFKKRVLENDKPVIVDFHATWCGPCKLLGPRLEKLLSEENGKVIMAKVDIDENSDLAMEYGVRSVPTVMGMKDGKVQSQFVGLIDDDQIQTFVDKLIIS
ncbi:thioredoxin [Elysia marginata]|uniref:Thioredoxin n=1 Tax=Elysia marginata TaxID=1093978 RepID=A0AAV4HIM7_9GAST|nr:thioredoxin [Elysia marginata]